MKLQPFPALTALLAASVAAVTIPASAENLVGNGSAGFSGAIGNGVLVVSDNGITISNTLTTGGPMDDVLVIYIDTGTGGFSSTAGFNDQGDVSRIAISGVSGSGRSLLTFTNGFSPAYAIALGPATNNYGYGGLYRLANGSLTSLGSVNLSPVNTDTGPFTFSFAATNLGLSIRTKANLRLFGTYISKTAFRSAEAIAGNDSVSLPGWNPAVQTGYANYVFANPQTNNPLVFTVDMAAQIANGSFNPANGDTVYVAGSYQGVPWSGSQLTPEPGHTNLYTGTNQDFDLPGTPELYKFRFHSVASNADTWEFGGASENRPNVCAAGTQTLPTVYFNDWAAHPSATTNAVTFQVDMTEQVKVGIFHPLADFVGVAGTFQTNQWTPGSAGFVLTNNPTGANSNLYSGTFRDGNYPGTWQEYKFVEFSSANNYTNWEYLNNLNRIFYDPTNSGTLPVAYFNDISPYANPVTFQVDMTLPILQGLFNPGGGDTVAVGGTFQTNVWTLGNRSAGGFVLTNNPTGPNTNLYSGTYSVFDHPATAEQYKFGINSVNPAIGELYETPASTGGNNRTFILSTTNQTLSAVYWDDTDPYGYSMTPTYVTFTVDMTGAVGTDGHHFDVNADGVYVNGQFANYDGQAGTWYPWAGGINPITSPYQLVEKGSGLIFTNTFQIPSGTPVQMLYQYGMDIASGNGNAANDEPGYFVRVLRSPAMNPYVLPTDVFGSGYSEPYFNSGNPGACELSVGKISNHKVPVTWLGQPGVHLQVCTNLTKGVWQDLNATDGSKWTAGYTSTNGFVSQTNYPAVGTTFYRLIGQ